MSLTSPNVTATNPLQMPVGRLMVWVEPLAPEDSLRAIAREIGELGVPAMPITVNHVLVGVVSEIELQKALANGASPDDAATIYMKVPERTLLPNTTGYEALRAFSETGESFLTVVDANGVSLGILTPSRLIEVHGSRQNLGRVGGMATPFGVYLTNGVVAGGVGGWALVATGMTMFSIFVVAGTIVQVLANMLPLGIQNAPWIPTAFEVVWMALFMLGIRLLPLSGTHAAEHMVVHAIERGEELKPEIVKRMPRVHPRCGTNLATAAILFLSIMSWDVIKEQELRLLLAALVTITVWQPLGSILQHYVTTRPPNDAQVAKGIEAGKQLLERMGDAPISKPSVFNRLARSGIFQVFVGATIIHILLIAIYWVLKVPRMWQVT